MTEGHARSSPDQWELRARSEAQWKRGQAVAAGGATGCGCEPAVSSSMNRMVSSKLKRLAGGEPPRLLDLFSGCGGLTLGFVRAGCTSLGAIETDPHAIRSHAANFHAGSELHAIPRDITKADPRDLLKSLGHVGSGCAVDVLVGGPPCPAFTRVGRAKLREVHGHPQAHLRDPRARLYIPYLQYVEALEPVALLMENVPDILNWAGINLAEVIAAELEKLGYHCRYTLLNAAHYGVPQMRERFFLVAIHRDAGTASFEFPRPVCSVDFPSGYHSSKEVAMKKLRDRELFDPSRHWVPSPSPPAGATQPVSVFEAIGDLPSITGHLNGTISRGARKFDCPIEYRAGSIPSGYARMMREWPDYESLGYVSDHVIRSLSLRDYDLFESMKPGDDYPKAHSLGIKFFDREVQRSERSGIHVLKNSQHWKQLRQRHVPPYDPTKFPNKWRKMEPDKPARTLMAHLGKDSYSHIHYDSKQARVISVREAARLQSFPDGFQFCGTMNPALRQIGNAVPPLLAWALANQLVEVIGGHQRVKGRSWHPELRHMLSDRSADRILSPAK